jgi:hypothetical protein
MPKSTEELLKILKNTPDLNTYLSEEKENIASLSLADYLNNLCVQKNISPAQCIKKTNLARTYAYQIFSGQKHPDRNKVLALCFGFSLSLDETQNLLKTTGYPILYAKTKRDSVIIFGLQRNCSLTDVNELLFEMNMELI